MRSQRTKRNRRNLQQTPDEAKEQTITPENPLAEVRDYLLECLQGATSAFDEKDYDLAISFLTRAIEIVPDKAEFWSFRGSCWGQIGNLSQAISDQSRVEYREVV